MSKDIFERFFNEPIPSFSIDNNPTFFESKFCDEKLYEIKNNDIIKFDPVYYKKHIYGSIPKCFVRETVYEMLCNVIRELPIGWSLLIFDAWRPLKVQEQLFYDYCERIRIENPGISEVQLKTIVSSYVSIPSSQIDNPPVHTTGGAIDLTLLDPFGQPLAMGTGFDDFSEKSNTAYFETSTDDNVLQYKNNRRILYNLMVNNGFTNLHSEWWHYDYGDTFWAKQKNKPAIYCGIFEL